MSLENPNLDDKKVPTTDGEKVIAEDLKFDNQKKADITDQIYPGKKDITDQIYPQKKDTDKVSK